MFLYAIQRGEAGQYLADGPVYTSHNLPQPIWQSIEGTRKLYLEETYLYALKRKERLEKIYTTYQLKVVKLTEEQMEYLSFRKLRGY